MKFTVNAKEFREAVDDCMLKGKYYSSSSKVGDYIYLEVSESENDSFELRLWNADMSTITMCAISATPTVEEGGLQLNEKVVFDTDNTNGFLKDLGENITLSLERGRLVLSTNDTNLSISIMTEHPYEGAIDMVKGNSMPLANEFQSSMTLPSFGKTQYETALEMNNNEFATAVKMAERIGMGFKLHYTIRDGLAISAESNSQNFTRNVMPLTSEGETSIVEISAPIYKFFNENFWLFLKDESPVFACSNNRFIIRAPRIS